jgi:hypothetical protein
MLKYNIRNTFLIFIFIYILFLFQEKDVVARSNPELHYNKAIVSIKETHVPSTD